MYIHLYIRIRRKKGREKERNVIPYDICTYLERPTRHVHIHFITRPIDILFFFLLMYGTKATRMSRPDVGRSESPTYNLSILFRFMCTYVNAYTALCILI